MLTVAQITKDHIYKDLTNSVGKDFSSAEGREFDYDTMREWWGWDDCPDLTFAPKVDFRLYDDDNELYYEGWLLNDDAAMVQQFVLRWAESYSGCTVITVKVGGSWRMEIG